MSLTQPQSSNSTWPCGSLAPCLLCPGWLTQDEAPVPPWGRLHPGLRRNSGQYQHTGVAAATGVGRGKMMVLSADASRGQSLHTDGQSRSPQRTSSSQPGSAEACLHLRCVTWASCPRPLPGAGKPCLSELPRGPRRPGFERVAAEMPPGCLGTTGSVWVPRLLGIKGTSATRRLPARPCALGSPAGLLSEQGEPGRHNPPRGHAVTSGDPVLPN